MTVERVDFTKPRRTKAKAPTNAAPQPPSPEGRPDVKITALLHENVDEAIRALHSDRNLFQRDGRLVQVTHASREESDRSAVMVGGREMRSVVEGMPQIRELATATLRERLTRHARFVKYSSSSDRWVEVLPTDPIVSAVAARGEWSGIPSLVGIVETPTLRPDGSVVQTPGYDASTGYVYAPSERFPPVPDRPTQEDAKKALAELAEVFVDFPYVEAAHRSVPIAAILTHVGRPAIVGSAPAFLYDKNTRGTGGTLQTDCIAVICTGRGASRMNYPTRVVRRNGTESLDVDETELEKILGSYALRGASLICLDNITAPFGGAPLDRVLTARDTVELRLLGTNRVPTLPWRAVILGSGNNLSPLRDTARRVLQCRLESNLADPEARTGFEHHPLIPWVEAERRRLVVAALTLLRAYFVADRPEQKCSTWGSFEEWSRLIPHAIVWAGGADPMGARITSDAHRDDDSDALRAILVELPKLAAARKNAGLPGVASEQPTLTAREIIEALYPHTDGPEDSGNPYPELRVAIEMLTGSQRRPSTPALGKNLGRLRGRVLAVTLDGDARELRRLVGHPDRNGVMCWCVEKASS